MKRSKSENRRIGKLAKRKGGEREREWVLFLKEHGILSARRTSQFNGKEGLADVIAPGDMDLFHQEVKGCEQLNLWKALEQANRDSRKEKGATPIVAHRKNGSGWIVSMLAEDWVEWVREIPAAMRILDEEDMEYEDEE
jgi:Holliday junction resolvase